MVVDSRSRMNKFVSGVFEDVVKECRAVMLIKDMDLSRLMVYAQQIEKEKRKDKEIENKKAKICSFNFSQQRSKGGKPILCDYINSNMAGDIYTCKSNSGYLVTFVGGAMSWQSRLQKCVALPITEAQLIVVVGACKELL
ncbi:uncharacterized protein LOC124895914 [Capsicum annuum]|uniref:uncharacterized protein LOC124895914 n=1 Tax=Capsicum annuum TaxID=4072 RepID=UPI001FB07851|nr:uncharacterized protein LOC124895914 [Capsicum annuum]